jgi:hypothetical protein
MQWQQAELHRPGPYTTEEEPQEHHQLAISQTDSGDSSVSHQLRESGLVNQSRTTVCKEKKQCSETPLASDEADLNPLQRTTAESVNDCGFGHSGCRNLAHKHTPKPPVRNTFEGWMTAYFSSGQTKDGSTHTIFGAERHGNKKCVSALDGDVLNAIEATSNMKLNLSMCGDHFQMYREDVFDLLANTGSPSIRRNRMLQLQSVCFTEQEWSSVRDLVHLTEHGTNDRTSLTTWSDSQSSGSHAKLLIDRAANDTEVTSCLKSHEGIEATGNDKPPLPLEGRIPELFEIGTHAPSADTSVPYIHRGSLVRGTTIPTLAPGDGSCGRRANSLVLVDLMEQLKKHMEEVTEHQMQLLNRLFALTSAPTNSLNRISPGRSIDFQRRQAQIKNPSISTIRRRRMKSKLMCSYA